MKYNINNLDQFISDKDRINAMVFEPSQKFINDVIKYQNDLIEKQLEKLIKPHVNLDKWGLDLSKHILDNKNLELKCIDSGEYTRYSVVNKITKEEDFFLVQNREEIKEENNKYVVTKYISEITRGII